MEGTREIIRDLDRRAYELYTGGDPVRLFVDGIRPKYLVKHHEPAVCERYGLLRNRAPIVSGSVALTGFMSQIVGDNVVRICCLVEAGENEYGFRVSSPALLNGVAVQLGRQDIEFSAVD